MRLSRKLTLPLSIAIFLVLAVAGVISVQRELALFGEDAMRDHHLVGVVLAEAAERELDNSPDDFARAERIVEQAGLRDPQLHAHFARLDELLPDDRKSVATGESVNHLDWSRWEISTLMPVRRGSDTVAAV